MARSRTASFSDDDLLIVSSQALSQQQQQEPIDLDLPATPLQNITAPNDIIDITSSPFASPFAADDAGPRTKGSMESSLRQNNKPQSNHNNNSNNYKPQNRNHNVANHNSVPVFGQTTQMVSPMVARQRDNVLFNTNKNRPEHHRPQRLTGPLAPKPASRKAAPRPVFSSLGSTQPIGGSSYSQPQPISGGTVSSSSYGDVDFYTDPNKAAADLKALLEGGMDEDEDDEEEPAPAARATSSSAAPSTAVSSSTSAKKKAKKTSPIQEDGTVPGIKVKLLPHQVEGVRWMMGRELGPVKRGRVPKGGILADDMGLGKTLQAISLIVSNPKPESRDSPGWKAHYANMDKTTLVVAPLALIRQWEAEIREKVETEELGLRVCVHHGPQRTVRPRDLAKFDVVITTYQILVSEHGHSNDSLKSGCFGVNWYRVVLDEAHSIKNRNAKTTKACCALSAEFRWCLTGTPMQNNLDELQSLVRFLRIAPYDNLAEWRSHIDAPLKNGRGFLAIRRLHSLLRCFMKRRTKDILTEEGALIPGGKPSEDKEEDGEKADGKTKKVPPTPQFKITERKVVDVPATFSPAERAFYDNLEARADKSLEKMIKGKNISYANALVLLLRLRQACNHPSLLGAKLDKDKDALAADSTAVTPSKSAKTTDGDIDDLADALGGLGIRTKQCEVCMSQLTREEQQASGDELVCAKCLEDRRILYGDPKEKKEKKEKKKIKKAKKVKKAKKAGKVKTLPDDDDEPQTPAPRRRKQRNRRAVLDSDDEDDEEEEADGSWLVGEDQQGPLRLGKAGGEEDENAEGGGDWIGSDDSESEVHSGDEDTNLSSFVVDDEKEKDVKGKKSRKSKTWAEESETESEDESFVSCSKEKKEEDEEKDEDEEEETETETEDEETDDSEYSDEDEDPFASGKGRGLMSAKIRQMLQLLRGEAEQHKFIVFSQFTGMLDVVEPFLSRAGWGVVRYDGAMRNDAREAALKSLRTDPHVRILLCSLKCGALGLNLTAATRVILLEPFWNPFVEEQAIDRVHRLTQTVDVVVYKLTVDGTVEQRILALQAKKRLLAQQALEGGHTGGRGKKGKKDGLKLGLQELMDLFRRDGPTATTAASSGRTQGEIEANHMADSLTQAAARGGDRGGLLRRRDTSKTTSSQTSVDSVYSRRW